MNCFHRFNSWRQSKFLWQCTPQADNRRVLRTTHTPTFGISTKKDGRQHRFGQRIAVYFLGVLADSPGHWPPFLFLVDIAIIFNQSRTRRHSFIAQDGNQSEREREKSIKTLCLVVNIITTRIRSASRNFWVSFDRAIDRWYIFLFSFFF